MDETSGIASAGRRTAAGGRTKGALAAAALLATLGASGAACAQSADSWTGPDKLKHFGLSAPFGIVGTSLVQTGVSPSQRILYGTLIGALPGFAKELSDAGRLGATVSARDMMANLVGAAVGALLADCCLVRPLAHGDRLDGVGVEYRIEF